MTRAAVPHRRHLQHPQGAVRSSTGRLVLHEIRERLQALDADVAFLQEVQGGTSATRAAT